MAAMAIRETYTLLSSIISSNLIFLEVLFLYKDEKIEASPVRLYSHYYSSNFCSRKLSTLLKPWINFII